MNTLREIYTTLSDFAPVETAESFDNVGLLVGDLSQKVGTVLLCLDISDAVIEEAIAANADLIISHHPLFLEPERSITSETAYGKAILQLIQHNISVISMHTNMDMATDGVNDLLCQALALQPDGRFSATSQGRELPYGRIGRLPSPMPVHEFAAYVAAKLGTQVQYAGSGTVQRIGMVGGSAGNMYAEALAADCDAFISGEVKHHFFLDAPAQGIAIFAAGHERTERMVVLGFINILSQKHPNLTVITSETYAKGTVHFA